MNEARAVNMEPGLAGSLSPFEVSWQKLMMWVFIVTDALLFAGFLAGYGFVRLASPQWPHRAEIFHLPLIGFMTFVLISSSATMAAAVAASRRAGPTALRLLGLTILGGLIFLGCQAYEWSTLIHQGASFSNNPWGVPLFSACFFLITGFHGTHVFTGLLILAITAFRRAAGRSSAEGVERAGLYWHFVDLVWVFIFTLFYLI